MIWRVERVQPLIVDHGLNSRIRFIEFDDHTHQGKWVGWDDEIIPNLGLRLDFTDLSHFRSWAQEFPEFWSPPFQYIEDPDLQLPEGI